MSRGKCLAEVFVIYLGEMVFMQRKQTSFRRPQPEKTANPLKVRTVGNLFGTCGVLLEGDRWDRCGLGRIFNKSGEHGEFCSIPVVKTPHFHCRGAWVPSLGGELRS